MTPSQSGLQGIPTRFLRRFWLTERATPTQKHLQGIIIRSVNFGLGRGQLLPGLFLVSIDNRYHAIYWVGNYMD